MQDEVERLRLKIEDNWSSTCVDLGCSKRVLDGAVIHTNTSFRWSGGFCNNVLRYECPDTSGPKVVKDALKHFEATVLPSVFYLAPVSKIAKFEEALARGGFARQSAQAFMTYCSQTPPAPVNPSVKVHALTSDMLPVFVDIVIKSFGWPEKIASSKMKSDRLGLRSRAFKYRIASLGDRWAGAGFLFSKEGVSGVHEICTLPAFRNRGVAKSIASHLVAEALTRGDEHIWLRAKAGSAEKLYKKIRFATKYIGGTYRKAF
jgi:GNAT superfamily N-acetyltransferase